MVAKFKAFFKELLSLLESLGRARAAQELARQGYYKEARKIMLGQ